MKTNTTFPTPETDAINTPAVCQIEATLCASLEQRLAECREALEFYSKIADYRAPFSESKLYYDCGKTARDTLANTATTFPAAHQTPNDATPQAPQAGSKKGGGEYIPTDDEVNRYMLAKLAEVHAVSRYGCVSLTLYGYAGTEMRVDARCDIGADSGHVASNLTDAVSVVIGQAAPAIRARKLRDAASKLITQADELESGGGTP